MYELLMKNKIIKDYTGNLFYSEKCEKVSINHDNKWYPLKIETFNDSI